MKVRYLFGIKIHKHRNSNFLAHSIRIFITYYVLRFSSFPFSLEQRCTFMIETGGQMWVVIPYNIYTNVFNRQKQQRELVLHQWIHVVV